MGRLDNDPHSATSQFFINTIDNDLLDHSGKTNDRWGYCVFGQVISGHGSYRTYRRRANQNSRQQPVCTH